jgi:hypothetical protein
VTVISVLPRVLLVGILPDDTGPRHEVRLLGSPA